MFKHFYYRSHELVRLHLPAFYELFFTYRKAVKYVISGGAATLANLLVLYTLAEYARLYYLIASVIAFIVSIAVSFSMQKFWTFRDKTTEGVHIQFFWYLLVVLGNLALNTLLVYALVEWLSVWYVLSQFLAGVVIAVIGFFAYRNFVFRPNI
ncbi:MAG: GtrA family protein [bacterium]|nr:GtrA family protein [bacterium]